MQSAKTATTPMKMQPLRSSILRTRLRHACPVEATKTATAATKAQMHSRRWRSQRPRIHRGGSRRPNPHRPLPFHERTNGAKHPEWHSQTFRLNSRGYLKCGEIAKSVAAEAGTGVADTAQWVVATAVGFEQNTPAGPNSPCRRRASTLLVQTEVLVATTVRMPMH